MIKRLLVGLVIGLVMGSLLAAALVKGLGIAVFGAALAYLFAAITGVVVGLVAGKPIWARGGQIEAGLKAVFGALLGAAAMFAIRRWLNVSIDLTALGAGHDVIGSLPAVALPMIAGVLGAFYEADNNSSDEDAEGGGAAGKKDDKAGASKAPAARAKGKSRVAALDDDELADADVDAAPSRRAKR